MNTLDPDDMQDDDFTKLPPVGRSATDEAAMVEVCRKHTNRIARIWEAKALFESFQHGELSTAPVPGHPASATLAQRDHDVIAFFGSFMTREDAVVLSWRLGVPELITEAMNQEVAWDMTPETLDQVCARIAELLPGGARYAYQPGLFQAPAKPDPAAEFRKLWEHHQRDGRAALRDFGLAEVA